MNRVGELEELAGPLLLASDAGSDVTGHTLVVDGGYSASIGGVRFENRTYDGFFGLVSNLCEFIERLLRPFRSTKGEELCHCHADSL